MNRWLLSIVFFAPPIFLGLGCTQRAQQSDASDPAEAGSAGVVTADPKGKPETANSTPSLNREETLEEVSRLAAAGEFKSALPLLQQLLLMNPS